MVWCGVVWCDVVWCGVMWCGVVWCGVVWCGVVWCGVVDEVIQGVGVENILRKTCCREITAMFLVQHHNNTKGLLPSHCWILLYANKEIDMTTTLPRAVNLSALFHLYL